MHLSWWIGAVESCCCIKIMISKTGVKNLLGTADQGKYVTLSPRPHKKETPSTMKTVALLNHHLATWCMHQRTNRQRTPSYPRSFSSARSLLLMQTTRAAYPSIHFCPFVCLDLVLLFHFCRWTQLCSSDQMCGSLQTSSWFIILSPQTDVSTSVLAHLEKPFILETPWNSVPFSHLQPFCNTDRQTEI